MTRVRKMLLAAGVAAAMAPAAMAQYSFPVQWASPGDSGSMNTSWQNLNLGTAPAATYSSYLVVADWFSVGGTYQYSSEATWAMTQNAGAGTSGSGGTAPTGAGTVYRNNGSTTATGSLASGTTAVTNMYWTGNMTNNFVSTGAENLNFAFSQRFASGVNNGRLQNLRVILNPVNTVSAPTNLNSVTGVAAPATFTDLGTIDTLGTPFNYNSPGFTTSASQRLVWFRFTLAYGQSMPSFLLDMDTENNANSSGTLDAQINMFIENGSGQLVGFAADDDDGTGTRSQLTFGDGNTGAGTRPYGVASGGLAYNGRDTNFAMPAGTYWVSVGQYQNDFGAGSLPTAVGSVGEFGLNSQWSFNNTTLNATSTTYGTSQFNLHFVPAPGSAALVGLAGLIAGRRRRQA